MKLLLRSGDVVEYRNSVETPPTSTKGSIPRGASPFYGRIVITSLKYIHKHIYSSLVGGGEGQGGWSTTL